jgi:hypothetical protein
VLTEEQMRIFVASLFNLGQQTLGPSKFFEDFISLYTDSFKENGKEHLFKTRSFLPEKIEEPQFFALLFHSSRLLTQQKTYSIPEEVDNLLNELLDRNPDLREMDFTEMMEFFKSNFSPMLERENKND